MQPTLVCLKIHEQLAEIMRLVDFSLNSRVDPLKKKKFIIYASQFMATFYLPKLINLLQHQSPNVEIVHHTLTESTNVDELLINRQADLILTFTLPPATL